MTKPRLYELDGRMVDAKEIQRLHPGKAGIDWVRVWLRKGLTAQEVIDKPVLTARQIQRMGASKSPWGRQSFDCRTRNLNR